MEWLSALAKLIGLADLWSKWFVRKQDEAVGEQRHENTDLRGAAAQQTKLAAIDDSIDALPTSDLVEQLRRDGAGQGGGDRQPGAGAQVPAGGGVSVPLDSR